MAINDITLNDRILDYQNDDNIIEFINSDQCTKEMVNEIGGNNMTALHIAASNNKYRIVKALLKKGADVNGMFYEMDNPGLPPLHMAIYYGSYDAEKKEENLKVINLLLEHKAHIDISTHSPFILASIKSKNEVVQLLLNYDIDIQFKDSGEKTGLDHMRYNQNSTGIKLVESHMLERALQEELTVTKSSKSTKLKV
jgi:ankyrin repeat protein